MHILDLGDQIARLAVQLTERRGMIDRPVPFQGSHEQRRANFRSHLWHRDWEGEEFCWRCESKPWQATAFYPCCGEPFGFEPPHELIPEDTPLEQQHPGFRMLVDMIEEEA